jgi:hypothetical protein
LAACCTDERSCGCGSACIKKDIKELFFTSASALDAFAGALPPAPLEFVVLMRVRGKSWVAVTDRLLDTSTLTYVPKEV